MQKGLGLPTFSKNESELVAFLFPFWWCSRCRRESLAIYGAMSLSSAIIGAQRCIANGLRGVGVSNCKGSLFRRSAAHAVRGSAPMSSSTSAEDADTPPSPLHRINMTDETEASRHSWDKLSDRTRSLAETLLEDNPTMTRRFDASRCEKPSSWWRHRVALSQAITLAESQSLSKQDQAGWLLTYLLHQPIAQRRRHQSFRIGIAGTSAEFAFVVFVSSALSHVPPIHNTQERRGQENPLSLRRWVRSCWSAMSQDRLNRILLFGTRKR
jgi:hypothetical protein